MDNHISKIRHLHIGFGNPCVADPEGLVRIVETSTARDPITREAVGRIDWVGWRASLVVWIINKLLPLRGMNINDGIGGVRFK